MYDENEKLYLTNKVQKGFRELNLPDHMLDGVVLYLTEGIPPGGFLTAVFTNDFKGVFGRADIKNQARIEQWAQFTYNFMPGNTQGSQEVFDAFLASHRKSVDDSEES